MPYEDLLGNFISLYYNVQIKNSTTTSWKDIYSPGINAYPTQSTDSNSTSTSILAISFAGTQVDIQLQAMIGYINSSFEYPTFINPVYSFVGQTSNWSPTQTVTLPANIPLSLAPASTSSTTTLSPTPTVPELSALAILPMFFVVFSILVILMVRKQSEIP